MEIGRLKSNFLDDGSSTDSLSSEVSQRSAENQIIKNENSHETQAQLCKLCFRLGFQEADAWRVLLGLGGNGTAPIS